MCSPPGSITSFTFCGTLWVAFHWQTQWRQSIGSFLSFQADTTWILNWKLHAYCLILARRLCSFCTNETVAFPLITIWMNKYNTPDCWMVAHGFKYANFLGMFVLKMQNRLLQIPLHIGFQHKLICWRNYNAWNSFCTMWVFINV